MLHLAVVDSYTVLAWKIPIVCDTPSQDDDKSSQEKKK